MRLKTLNQRHSCSTPDLFCKYQALYEGGQLFHKNINKFMNQSLIEDGFTYNARKREAYYLPYINSIVNQFASQLFSSPFAVRVKDSDNQLLEQIDEFYAEFKEDADLKGTDLSDYLRAQFITALIKGCAWFLAELPEDDNPPPDNLLDYQSRNLGRAWLCSLKPDDVLDWEYDEFNQLIWVITHTSKCIRPDPRQERELTVETWKIYDQQEVETFSITYDKNHRPKPEDIIPSLGKKPHGFTRIPLIEMRLPVGLWLVNRLADVQLEHFRQINSLSWAFRRASSPTLVFKTDGNSEDSRMQFSDGFGVKIGKEESLEYTKAPSDSFDSMMKQVSSLKDELYRLATQMALSVDNSASTVKRSGDSKAQDAQATEICLHAFASIVKETIEEIYELISDARGDTNITFSIEGMDQFNVIDVDQVINSAKIAKELNLQSETFNKELQVKVAEALLPNISQESKDTIRQEIMSAKIDLALPEQENLSATDNNSEQTTINEE